MDLKFVFLLILGITTSILIYTIIRHNTHEGFSWDPVGDAIREIKRTINDIVYGVNVIICFVDYLVDVLAWFTTTIESVFHLFVPPCPFFYILDIIVAFIGFILGSLLRLLYLGMLIDAFSTGCDGINFVTKSTIGIAIFDYHEWMGIKPTCYDPKYDFKTFPEFKKPERRDYI